METLLLLLIGLATGALVMIALRERGQAAAPMGAAPLALPSVYDRRRLPRRAGRPTAVTVVGLGHRISSQRGFIMDRSAGGVRLAMPTRVGIGSLIQVRPLDATDELPWISAVVRNGRFVGDYYEAGCEFDPFTIGSEIEQLG